MLKIFLQEEGNAVSEATKSISNATQKVIGVKDSIAGYFGADTPSKPTEKAPPTVAPTKSMSYLVVFSLFFEKKFVFIYIPFVLS